MVEDNLVLHFCCMRVEQFEVFNNEMRQSFGMKQFLLHEFHNVFEDNFLFLP